MTYPAFVAEESSEKANRAMSPERAESVRRFVRAKRKALGLTEADYAERTKISQSQMNGFMNGKSNGGLALLEKIADREGVSLDELVGRSAPSVPASDSPTDRARAAAVAIGFPEAAIRDGLSDAKERDDAWAVLGRIEMAARAISRERETSVQPQNEDQPKGHDAATSRALKRATAAQAEAVKK